jgi:hypothetical protein
MATFLVAAAIFSFQNNFWVNLHQFLHAEAGRRAAGQALRFEPSTLPQADRAAWEDALTAYGPISKRDHVRDAGLIAVNDALSQVEGDTLPTTIEPAIGAALTRAAPVYRAGLWPEHRRANEAWIATMRPIIERIAPSLTVQLAQAYHASWPSQPILVDVSHAAGRFGAYTTLQFGRALAGHATVSSFDEGSDGEMGVETVFHEASHTIGPSIMRMIAAEARSQNVAQPPNLWHALIFYTTGELVRRALGKTGDSHYLPYAYRFSVYEKGMLPDRGSLEKNWQPWLDGKVSFEQALRNLVRDVAR